MDDFQDRIGAILNNPQMMGQILSMAQALGQSSPSQPAQRPQTPQPSPEVRAQPRQSSSTELSMLQGLLQKPTGPDAAQRMLLQALQPYLGPDKLHRLERAIQAAHLAQLASSMLGQMGTPSSESR